ncbi:hypothetical protein MKW94_025145 [Papaver nudicaule]|uniref:DUF7787 domain-containing protein n=1 Tax=Papaver nudicaule TaxID=74823 RepID=A0AA41UTB8_PAPNU|nr:hypothetical protein [Papaver nudicaule]
MVGASKYSLSLENYVDFFQNPQQHFLNKKHLNQVMSMHGFLKLEVPRADIVEELKTLTLESPFRSTLKENITSSSAALLDPEEINKDLATLRWNEWSIDSIQIHRSGREALPPGEERQYSIKFVESEKSSSSKKTPALKKNKKGLTDISNLPADNLNSSNSKQIQAKKKISTDSDSATVQGTNGVKSSGGRKRKVGIQNENSQTSR